VRTPRRDREWRHVTPSIAWRHVTSAWRHLTSSRWQRQLGTTHGPPVTWSKLLASGDCRSGATSHVCTYDPPLLRRMLRCPFLAKRSQTTRRTCYRRVLQLLNKSVQIDEIDAETYVVLRCIVGYEISHHALRWLAPKSIRSKRLIRCNKCRYPSSWVLQTSHGLN